MTDRTTKLLLAIIALGLWAHLIFAVAPQPVEAQSLGDAMRQDKMLDALKAINNDTAALNRTLSNISTDTLGMKTSLQAIATDSLLRRR